MYLGAELSFGGVLSRIRTDEGFVGFHHGLVCPETSIAELPFARGTRVREPYFRESRVYLVHILGTDSGLSFSSTMSRL